MNTRNRPMMVIKFTYVPAEGQNTSQKNFAQTAEWDPVENMQIVDNLKNKDLHSAELVIDLLTSTLYKCRDRSLDDKELVRIFTNRYAGEIKVALTRWVANNPDNLQELRKLNDKKDSQDGNSTDRSNSTDISG